MLGKKKTMNVHAIEDTLLNHEKVAPMNWFGYSITFVLANKNLMMSCKSKSATRTYCIRSDSGIYDALRKLSPRGYFRLDSEMMGLVDDMIHRRTALKGEHDESVFERVCKA